VTEVLTVPNSLHSEGGTAVGRIEGRDPQRRTQRKKIGKAGTDQIAPKESEKQKQTNHSKWVIGKIGRLLGPASKRTQKPGRRPVKKTDPRQATNVDGE